MIKSKLKVFLNELKKLKIQTVLALYYKKRNDCQIFHSSTKLIASDSDIDEAFLSRHQNIMTKIKIMLVRIGLSRCNCKAWY